MTVSTWKALVVLGTAFAASYCCHAPTTASAAQRVGEQDGLLAQAEPKTEGKSGGKSTEPRPKQVEPAQSTDKPATDKPATSPTGPGKPTNVEQDLDGLPPILEPKNPESALDRKRREARAWFATGRILEARNNFAGALNAYRKAVALDPEEVLIYRAMIPLAFTQNAVEEGLKWAFKAAELDPTDFDLLRRLGAHQASQGDFASAVKLFDQARKSPTIPKASATYVQLHRDLAVLYKALGKHAESADAYEVVFEALQEPEKYKLDATTRTKLLGDGGNTYEKIGQAFLDAKRLPRAIDAFKKAGESKKSGAGNLAFNLAQVYMQMEKFDLALTELQKYFDEQRQSKGKAAYELLATILEKSGKKSELLAKLETLAEADSRNSTLQFFLADQYLAADRLSDAETLYQKTLATTPETVGFVGLATVYRRQNKASELVDTLSKAYLQSGELKEIAATMKSVAEDSKLLEAIVKIANERLAEGAPKLEFPQAYVLANLCAAGKKSEETEKLYMAAIAARKDRSGLVFDELGQHFLDVKKYAEAAKVYEQAAGDAALAEQRPSLLFQLSQAHELAGNTKSALAAIVAAQQILPDAPLLQFQEAWIYYHAHQYEEAIKRYERVVEKYPQPQFKSIVRRCHFALSAIHVAMGNQRKGEEILEVIYKENPDDPSVCNDLGYLYADQGKNLEQAEKMIKKALDAEPENGAYLDSMGWVLYRLGKFEEAVKYLEKAVAQSTSGDETLWDHLGDAYDKLGKKDKAVEAWKKGLEAAKMAKQPDQKLIEKINAKLK